MPVSAIAVGLIASQLTALTHALAAHDRQTPS